MDIEVGENRAAHGVSYILEVGCLVCAGVLPTSAAAARLPSAPQTCACLYIHSPPPTSSNDLHAPCALTFTLHTASPLAASHVPFHDPCSF